MRCALLALALSLAGAGIAAQALQPSPLVLSPAEWKFGVIDQGETPRLKVVVMNRGDLATGLDIIPTCPCLRVEPARILLAPGASSTVELSYDSSDDSGKTEKGYLLVSDAPGAARGYFLASGIVRVLNVAAGGAWLFRSPGSAPGTGTRVSLLYYYAPGCRACEEFLAETIPGLERELSLRIDIQPKDILDPARFEELRSLAENRGTRLGAVPALVVGKRILQGEAEIRAELAGLLREAAATEVTGAASAFTSAGGGEASAAAGSATSSVLPIAVDQVSGGARLAILPIIAAGLIDGINPCAFTTLIFLIASLALAGRGRRDVLIIGALFSLSVFLTYLAMGLGLFAALRALGASTGIASALRWILAIALVALAGASLWDYRLIRAGRAAEMVLQLPNALKLRIHASIRTRARAAAIAGSTLVLGFLVSVFEFACTGQVYLPTLAYLARTRGREAILLLALYNLCFIAPLVAVFAASYLGVGSKRITALFQAQLGKTKLALAAAFIGLALLTLFG